MIKRLFRKKSSAYKVEKFTDTGTVFASKIINFDKLASLNDPEALIRILKQYLDLLLPIIEKYSGVVLRFEGDTVLAFWSSKHKVPSHAQLAFDASRAILDSLLNIIIKRENVIYNVDIVLGTGDVTGDFMGPTKQFQIIGKAMAIVTRLSRARRADHSLIRMSQHTANLLCSEGLQQTEIITADDTEELEIFIYCPARS